MDQAEALNRGEVGHQAEARYRDEAGRQAEARIRGETWHQTKEFNRVEAMFQPHVNDTGDAVSRTDVRDKVEAAKQRKSEARADVGNHPKTMQSKFSIAFLSQSTSERSSRATTSATNILNSAFTLPFEYSDIFSTPTHMSNRPFTTATRLSSSTTRLGFHEILTTPTHISNSAPNTPFTSHLENEAVYDRSSLADPDTPPFNYNTTIENMTKKIANLENKMEGMVKEMNQMKSLIEAYDPVQSRYQQAVDANAAVVTPAPRVATVQPDFTNRGILECKGASFIKGTTFTQFELNNVLDDMPSNFPRIVLDLAVAATISEVHGCKCAEDLAKWMVLEAFSLRELYGSSCGTGRGGTVKTPLENGKIQMIKNIVLKMYGKGENEKLNLEMWQRCKDKINRSVRYLNTKIRSHTWIKVGLV
jgi:hypothetical protein